MAINKKLIHFKTYAAYKKEVDAGNIPDYSIVFIKDAKKIVTHGWEGNLDSLTTTQTQQELDKKQDKLIAGNGIKITADNIISTTLDTSVFRIVSELPTEDIEENKIYLVPGETQSGSNIYTEYLYIEGKWEILGEYRAEFDVEQYLKIEDYNKWRDGLPWQSVESIFGQLIYNPYNVQVAYLVNSRHGYDYELEPADNHNFVIDGVTQENAGVMPAADKVKLDAIDLRDFGVEVNIPIRTLSNKVYTQEEILAWFGVTKVTELKKMITSNSQMFLRYGITLSTNPMYYRMPIQYIAFEDANTIKIVTIGLNTRNDDPVKYIITIALDGTILDGNRNIKIELVNIAYQDYVKNSYVLNGLFTSTAASDVTTAITSIDSLVTAIQEHRILVDKNNDSYILPTRYIINDDNIVINYIVDNKFYTYTINRADSILSISSIEYIERTEFEQYKTDTKAITDKLRTDIDYEHERALEAEANINKVLDKAVLFDDTKKIITIPESGALSGVFVGEQTAGCNIAALKNYGEGNVLEIGSTQAHLTLNTSDNIQVDTPDGTKHVAYQEDIDNKYSNLVIDSALNNLDNYNTIKSRIENGDSITVTVLDNQVYYPVTVKMDSDNIVLTVNNTSNENTGFNISNRTYTIDNTGHVTVDVAETKSIYDKPQVDKLINDVNVNTIQWIYFSQALGLEEWQKENNIEVFTKYGVAWEGGLGVNDIDTSFRLIGTAQMDNAKSKCTITGVYQNYLYTYTLLNDGTVTRVMQELNIGRINEVYILTYPVVDQTVTEEEYTELTSAIANNKVIVFYNVPDNTHYVLNPIKSDSTSIVLSGYISKESDEFLLSSVKVTIPHDTLAINISSDDFTLQKSGFGSKFLSDNGTYVEVDTDVESDVYVFNYTGQASIQPNEYEELRNAINSKKAIYMYNYNNNMTPVLATNDENEIILDVTPSSVTSSNELTLANNTLTISSDGTMSTKAEGVIINTKGDGTQFLSNDGTYKTVNAESDVYVLELTDNGSGGYNNVTEEQYNDLVEAITSHKVINVIVQNNMVTTIKIATIIENGIILTQDYNSTDIGNSGNVIVVGGMLYIRNDYSIDIISSQIKLSNNGDGTKFLSNDGEYRTIESNVYILELITQEESPFINSVTATQYNELKEAINEGKDIIVSINGLVQKITNSTIYQDKIILSNNNFEYNYDGLYTNKYTLNIQQIEISSNYDVKKWTNTPFYLYKATYGGNDKVLSYSGEYRTVSSLDITNYAESTETGAALELTNQDSIAEAFGKLQKAIKDNKSAQLELGDLSQTHYFSSATSLNDILIAIDNKMYELEQSLTIKE